MRPTGLQLTLRRCMVLTAVVAMLMGAVMSAMRLRRLGAEYRRVATEHARQEQNARGILALLAEYGTSFEGMTDVSDQLPADPDARRKVEALLNSDPELSKMKHAEQEMRRNVKQVEQAAHAQLDYHARLRSKYERAAARPWLALSADPKDPGYRLLEMMQSAMQRNEALMLGLEAIPLPPGLEMIGSATDAAPSPTGPAVIAR